MKSWKWILSCMLFCLPLAAAAEDLQPSAPKNDKDKNVTIIDGKKFFSLRNARHFSGDVKPMPAGPQRQFNVPPLVQHNQMAPSVVRKPEADTNNDISAHTAIIPATPPENRPAGGDSNSKVLDIFTPQEKGQ